MKDIYQTKNFKPDLKPEKVVVDIIDDDDDYDMVSELYNIMIKYPKNVVEAAVIEFINEMTKKSSHTRFEDVSDLQ
jgi:UDP-glucose 6-dehydrogenase